jgi:hypothetical protein
VAKPKERKVRAVNAGKSVTTQSAITSSLIYDKPARRIVRAEARRKASRIERKILEAQREHAEATQATENGHAARRLLAKERAHRRQEAR